jgi:hypothetical protein
MRGVSAILTTAKARPDDVAIQLVDAQEAARAVGLELIVLNANKLTRLVRDLG